MAKNDLNILDMIEEEESKRDSAPKTKRKAKSKAKSKAKEDKPKPKKKPKSKAKKPQATDNQPLAKGNDLPDKVQKKKFVATEGCGESKTTFTVDDIKATSRTVYVHDIHDVNPQMIAERCNVVFKDHRFVLGFISKEDYDHIISTGATAGHDIINVVDCSYNPTLSYGFHIHLLKGDFPTLDEVEHKDKDFRENPTSFRNPELKLTLKRKEQQDKSEEPQEEKEVLDDEEVIEFG